MRYIKLYKQVENFFSSPFVVWKIIEICIRLLIESFDTKIMDTAAFGSQNYAKESTKDKKINVYPTQQSMTIELSPPSLEATFYRDNDKIKKIQDEILLLNQQASEPNICFVFLCGISSYAMSTNAILERRALEKLLDQELSKPLHPESPNIYFQSMYQDVGRIEKLQHQIRVMERNKSNDKCCYFCYGYNASAYTSYKLTKRQDLRYQLERELNKPVQNFEYQQHHIPHQ
ncbi:uncharacterized protein B0P05DRAFT_147606 [Gilbertella persicaria]|uniref:uncharacterized protein n=1 Tax=Gilbertella persicaria TaxID=101096 RepID=UPI002220AD46|nr:uncharacterized protein B0P05DRAFT_147606 [Gilbertella persicaria]KAI8075908.1 hypothetical protein B0P05DRAFT_147606 [Gilbertella persicaria]